MTMKRFLIAWWVVTLGLFQATCGPTISPELRRQIDPDLTLAQVQKSPEAYTGRMVMFSGVILEAVNNAAGTLITVLERPTDFTGRPKAGDESGGRFLAQDPRYLDVAIHAPGRIVTVAGVVDGHQIRPLGEITYDYPVIRVKELHLWRSRPEISFGFGYSTSF